MNKKIIKTLCSLLAIFAIVIFHAFTPAQTPVLWEDDFENSLFMFNSSRHVVHNPQWMASGIPPNTFEEFDSFRHPGRAIIIGEVAGPSINRIINPKLSLQDFSVPSGDNHVITPILVHYIIFLGEDIDETLSIQVGDVIDLMEGYFYVTPETQAYIEGVPLGQILTNWAARPMEAGNRYLIYMHDGENRPDSIYRYNDELILGAFGNSRIYILDPVSPLTRLDNRPGPQSFPGWHEAAMAMYGHLYFELPATPPSPVVVPRTPDEINIIIQGAPIATAIYDAAGNRLIQDGLGLYRQTTGGGRERVGQRVSISHALRRFQYILEPGEYIFKDLNFAETNLPSNVQVLGFENSERVALAYYADSPSSAQMELHIMPGGGAQLTDKVTNTVIPPTEIYPLPGEINRSALIAAITEAESRIQINYTPASWQEMTTALTSARTVRDNPNATQEIIDSVKDMLLDALARLEVIGPVGGSVSTVTFDEHGNWLRQIDITVFGAELTFGDLELKLSGDVIDFLIAIDGEYLSFMCCCEAENRIPFNNITDTEATMMVEVSQAGGSFVQLLLEVYFNGASTGYIKEIGMSVGGRR